MSEVRSIQADVKQGAGKGPARAIRRQGRVPAIVYGDGGDPVMVSVGLVELWKGLRDARFFSTVMHLNVDGKDHQVLPRAVQFDRVTDQPIHVDFMRVSDSSTVKVRVPVIFENEPVSPGMKRGAVLNVVRKAVEVSCLAKDIPAAFALDLTGTDVNDSLKWSDVSVPDSVTPTIRGRDFVIATLTAPSALKRAQMEAAREAARSGGGGGDAEEAEE